jgi:hypothetical protein
LDGPLSNQGEHFQTPQGTSGLQNIMLFLRTFSNELVCNLLDKLNNKSSVPLFKCLFK